MPRYLAPDGKVGGPAPEECHGQPFEGLLARSCARGRLSLWQVGEEPRDSLRQGLLQ